jgi:hypothetical protein
MLVLVSTIAAFFVAVIVPSICFARRVVLRLMQSFLTYLSFAVVVALWRNKRAVTYCCSMLVNVLERHSGQKLALVEISRLLMVGSCRTDASNSPKLYGTQQQANCNR